MKSSEVRYLNFPIQLLGGFMDNHVKCLFDILCYAAYAHSKEMYNDHELIRIEKSCDYFGIYYKTYNDILINGKRVYHSIDSKSPKSGINVNKWREYTTSDTSEYQKVCLLAFIALKSIVQRKACCKTNNNLMFARMAGMSKWNEALVVAFPEWLKKYIRTKDAKIYYAAKIRTELEINWKLVCYSHKSKGVYISFKMNRENLVCHAEAQKKINKVEQLKEANKLAREKALIKLNTPPPTHDHNTFNHT